MLDTTSDKLQAINPYIKYTHVLVQQTEVVGFFIATTTAQTELVNKTFHSWRMQTPDLFGCFNYMHEALPDDLILHDIAIDLKYRGCGFFKILHKHLIKLAADSSCKRIIFIVHDSNPAIQVYKHYGAKIISRVNATNNHRFIECYFAL